jgi:hypothetical protein
MELICELNYSLYIILIKPDLGEEVTTLQRICSCINKATEVITIVCGVFRGRIGMYYLA